MTFLYHIFSQIDVEFSFFINRQISICDSSVVISMLRTVSVANQKKEETQVIDNETEYGTWLRRAGLGVLTIAPVCCLSVLPALLRYFIPSHLLTPSLLSNITTRIHKRELLFLPELEDLFTPPL